MKIRESGINHIDHVKDLDIAGKKGLLKLVFKNIKVLDGRLKSFELYEPFKSLYEGEQIKCQTQENKTLLTIPESVCTYVLSDVR